MTLWPNALEYWPYMMTCSSMERMRDHNANIINLFNVAQKGLIFNSKMCTIKQESVTFFGGVFSAEGYSPDPEKTQGISEMTPPQTKQELQSFLGAVNYLQMFVPHLSSNTEPLCAPPQEGELLCMGREHPTPASRKSSPNCRKPSSDP